MEKQPKPVRILLFAAYGERPNVKSASTPIVFTHTLGLADLLLRRSEFQQLVDGYNSTPDGRRLPVSPIVANALFHATNGHAGLSRRSLEKIGEYVSLGTTAVVKPSQEDVNAAVLGSFCLLSSRM